MFTGKSMENRSHIHVLHIVGEPLGGIRKHIHDIMKSCDPGIVRFSYVFSTTGQDAVFKSEFPSITRNLIAVLPLPISKLPMPMDVINLIRLAHFVRKHRVTIIHGHGAKGGLYARFLTLFSSAKSIYTPHGGSLHNMFGRIAGYLYITAEKFMQYLSDCLVFESEHTAALYEEKVGIPGCYWCINNNGLAQPDLAMVLKDAEILNLRGHFGEFYHIGVFGILRQVKGQHIAIQALFQLHDSGRKAVLHLIGHGPDHDSLVQLVKKLRLDPWVIFHGDVTNVMPYIYAMDVVVVPSLFESFGYAALEAIFLRKWVIASDTGGLKYLIKDGKTGTLVPAGDAKALSKAIVQVWDDTPTLHEEEFQTTIQHYSMANMSAKITNVYKKLST